MGQDARALRVEGAAENNLRDVDLSLPPGLTAVVGVSGSGKSSLVFDTLYHEARRRFLQSLSLGSPWLRMRPARVRAIHGLGPAVAVAQNVVNRNPNSTLATAAGIHPFLRVLYARFAECRCSGCGTPFVRASLEVQLVQLRALLERTGEPVEVVAPLVRGVVGSHARLLAELRERFPGDALAVDGRRWCGASLDAQAPHDVAVRVGTLDPAADAATLREALETVAELGSVHVTFRADSVARTLTRANECAECGAAIAEARPQDFRTGDVSADYRLAGKTFDEFLRQDVAAALRTLDEAGLPPRVSSVVAEVRRRLAALSALELDYLTLDRPSPTLSRGEAQRVRLAIILANRVEDLLHVVDEPSIGLDAECVGRVVREIKRLRGPVVLVEHDRSAVARADHVVELGPGAGSRGGTVVFEGTPSELWSADTASGRWFSGRERVGSPPARREATERLVVRGASLRNLAGFDCAFPVGAFTVVTGASGAGKTTLVKDVLVASLGDGQARGCRALEGPKPRPVLVDQSPIGRNPRSNAATYTGLATRIRGVFAKATGLPPGVFSFNRSAGACEVCEGIGAVEVRLRFLPSEWLTCEACQGRRFADDVLAAAIQLPDGSARTIADLYDASVDEALPLLEQDRSAWRILDSLRDVGLGYMKLGQPSTTLSGGEAQRVKLARQLARARPGELIFLDEPTTGLHPADVSRLVSVLRRLVESGCTVVVVEHNPDVVGVADWLVRLGPMGGPEGGRLLHEGPPTRTKAPTVRPRAEPTKRSRSSDSIRVRGAVANNLRNVSVAIPKNRVTAVVGVSGSGKSSLVADVLAAEATRRLLESLSLYERQSLREGPEAGADAVVGLGPTVSLAAERRRWDLRSTVGTATELSFHLGVLLSYAGSRRCPSCRGEQRRAGPLPGSRWRCSRCGKEGPAATPAHFSPATYEAACLRCHGIGTVQVPRLERLVVHPERPICDGALYSPGFFPGTYLSSSEHGGYWMLQALAQRYEFDPEVTPWSELTDEARDAFLYGEEQVQMPAEAARSASRTVTWRGVFRILSNWDVGGLYTDQKSCPACAGGRLRPEFLDVTLDGANRQALYTLAAADVGRILADVEPPAAAPPWVEESRTVARARLEFLDRVGLGYVHLDRLSATLSAGEAQRVKLASLLGSRLRGLTILLDEPSRGLHPSEVEAVADAVCGLRDRGNTVVFVDHDERLVEHADHVLALGPGAGRSGGRVVARGPLRAVRKSRAGGRLLTARSPARTHGPRAEPSAWMRVRRPTENNLVGDDVRIPLGVLAGICGVSGSGKSTLAIDIVARALAPARITTSVAMEAIRPGAHAGIDDAPRRTVYADQGRAGIGSPGAYLGVLTALRRVYGGSPAAAARRLRAKDLAPRCDDWKGRGSIREDMGFLPPVERPCDACDGTGYRAEAREVRVRGLTLPELELLTLGEVLELWEDHDTIARPLRAACAIGLGYLVLGQAARALSGGERQRLKLARELAKPTETPTLYILDEPTVGLHALDVEQLVDALAGLVERGHGVLVVEHDPRVLASCDYLLELGPGGGPDGGRVVAAGTPEEIARAGTATAPFLQAALP
jgi:excinuclease ABC subunit A